MLAQACSVGQRLLRVYISVFLLTGHKKQILQAVKSSLWVGLIVPWDLVHLSADVSNLWGELVPDSNNH